MEEIVRESFDEFVNENGSSRMFDPGRFAEYIMSDLGTVISESELEDVLEEYVDQFGIYPEPKKTDQFMTGLSNFLVSYGALK